MAIYFLEKSPSYKQRTSQEVFNRRGVVSKHLSENYKVRRNKDDETYSSITAELRDMGIVITASTYQADKVLIRTAYLWLVSSENEKKKLESSNSPGSRVGINCLVADGIKTWADLDLAGTVPDSEDAIVPEAPAPRFKLSECVAGAELLGHFSLLVESLEAMLSENQQLKDEVARLTEEAAPLNARAGDDQEYICLVESELATAEQRSKDLRETIRSSQMSAHAATLESIAEEYPAFPQLTVIAQQIKELRSKKRKSPELTSKLPAKFDWLSNSDAMEYRDPFLKSLELLPDEEQAQVIRQIETLASFGPEYASLHTRKVQVRIPYSPPDCMTSRGADDLRFSWKKNGHVVIYWLFRKGDSRVRQSEQ